MFTWQFSIADPDSQSPLANTLWAMSLRGPLLKTHLDWYPWLFLSSPSILMGKRNPAGTRSLFCYLRHLSCHLASMLPFWLLPIHHRHPDLILQETWPGHLPLLIQSFLHMTTPSIPLALSNVPVPTDFTRTLRTSSLPFS